MFLHLKHKGRFMHFVRVRLVPTLFCDGNDCLQSCPNSVALCRCIPSYMDLKDPDARVLSGRMPIKKYTQLVFI